MSAKFYPEGVGASTVRLQLLMACQNVPGGERAGYVVVATLSLITQSDHEILPFLASFVGLGLSAFNLYRCIAFDKLHVFDLSITRHFCDYTNTINRESCNFPLARVMAVMNDCVSALTPPPTSLAFCLSTPLQRIVRLVSVEISGSAPLLMRCVIGVSNSVTDEDNLLHSALRLSAVNSFESNPMALTAVVV